MQISLLAKREPFARILEQTLLRFLPSLAGPGSYQVRWRSGTPRLRSSPRNCAQVWVCNTRLNAIFALGAHPSSLTQVRNEFGRSDCWWRRLPQRAYVGVATCRTGAPWLAQASLIIAPGVPDAESWLIVPGNNKIRLLNRECNVSYCVLKAGFPPDFMQREFRSRRQAASLGLPVPGIRTVGDDGLWFSEPYLCGTPINRLNEPPMVAAALSEALRSLRRLIDDTARERCPGEYAEEVRTRIRALTIENRLLAKWERLQLLQATDALSRAASRLGRNASILTAIVHGDFQPGNILVDDNGIWLIDWEYSGRRQAQHDALVYALETRFPNGIAERLRMLLAGQAAHLVPADVWWPDTPCQDERRRRLHAVLLVLEELAIRIEQNSNSSFYDLDPGFRAFQRELQACVKLLQ